MALSQDEATGAGRGRAVDTHRDKGLVLYRSDFDAGFDGWTDHWDGFRPWPILSLTEQIQLRGKRSLMLSTGEHSTPNAGDPSNSPATFKRMTRHDEYRYHSFSAHLALGIGNFSGSWQSFSLFIDTQQWGSGARSFFKAQCVSSNSPTFDRWQIRGNGGDSDFINVPSSNRSFTGNNDNKQNFQYVRLTVDLAANSGLGGYKELQVGKQVFDLTGLGGGSATEPVQWDGSNLITDFNGGFNIGLGVSRNQSATGGCQLFADDITYSVSNTL